MVVIRKNLFVCVFKCVCMCIRVGMRVCVCVLVTLCVFHLIPQNRVDECSEVAESWRNVGHVHKNEKDVASLGTF